MARPSRQVLGALFFLIAAGFAGIAYAAAREGGGAWVVGAASTVLALWMGGLALGVFRRL